MNGSRDRNTAYFLRGWIRIAPAFLLTFFLFGPVVHGQDVEIEAHKEPLNTVLIGMAEQYGIQLSFDDRLLSGHTVTVHRKFDTPEAAIAYLLEPLPLNYQKTGEVYIIFRQKDRPGRSAYRIQGRIVDLRTGESLPHTHMVIDGRGLITDFTGRFSASSTGDPGFSVSISHLGYYRLDTLLSEGRDHTIGLQPSVFKLKEVTVEGRSIERSGVVGEEAGLLRLNPKVAYRLPGNGDDAVFNFLRLQPGILASGEQSGEMIIWGCYPGQSQLLFDGFTIFGPKNFNDNISFVNPYMVKDIRVFKGGYPAMYGERVGGIVEVSGINGSREKPSLNMNINNMTVSGMAGLPVMENAALTLAFRHTYYNLYDAEDMGLFSERGNGNSNNRVDITISPDYRFRDVNLKYAGAMRNGDPYFISLFGGGDRFSYSVEEERNAIRLEREAMEMSRQQGGTASIGRTWDTGLLSNFSLSYSGLHREVSESQEMYHKMQGFTISNSGLHFTNSIREVAFRNVNHFNGLEKHRVAAGLGYVYSDIGFLRNYVDVISTGEMKHAGRINFFVQDAYQPFKIVSLKPGIRIDYPIYLQQLFIQPRIQFSVKPDESWKFNGAWGLYNQFMAETSVLDELGNYRYFWVLCDNQAVPVLRGQHFVGGGVFRRGDLTVSMESFYKTVRGIARLVDSDGSSQEAYQGQARVYGTDFLVKYYMGKHEGWVSYTISRTEEYFRYFTTMEYTAAPQDQRHEIKSALLLDLKPFYLSLNYVYGSGLAYLTSDLTGSGTRYPYSRLDAALIYRLALRKMSMEAGISVLNVFNRENIKHSNLIQVPDGQSGTIRIHAEAIPFTPTLYLNLTF